MRSPGAVVGLAPVRVQVSCIEITTSPTVWYPCLPKSPSNAWPPSGVPGAPWQSSCEPATKGQKAKAMQIVLTISEWLLAHFPVVCTSTAPEERLGADKQQRPAGNNGLTKRSGPSISHESSLHVFRTADHHNMGNWIPKTRIRAPAKLLSQKFFDPMLPPSLIIKKERQKNTRRRAASPTWCYSRETPSLVSTLTGSPNFASIPAAKPILRPSRLVQHSPRCSVLFFHIHPCAPTLHNVTLPGFATDGRATLAYTVQPHYFLLCFGLSRTRSSSDRRVRVHTAFDSLR